MNKQQSHLKKKYKKYGYRNRSVYACGFWYDEDKQIYIKIERNKYSKWVKRQSNRKVRRYKHDIANYSGYRKVGEDWLWLY